METEKEATKMKFTDVNTFLYTDGMGTKITRQMKIGEIIDKFPDAAGVIMKSGINFTENTDLLFETLEGAAGAAGTELDPLMKELNKVAGASVKLKVRELKKIKIEITKAAIEMLEKIMKEKSKEGCALRLGITGEGCEAYTYYMDFEKTPGRGDIVIVQNGIRMFLEWKSLRLLDGTVIDYDKEQDGFKISRTKNFGEKAVKHRVHTD